jgi:hypothetical protein
LRFFNEPVTDRHFRGELSFQPEIRKLKPRKGSEVHNAGENESSQ